MNGNGCAGSIASGVSTGNTRSMNQASSQVRSSSDNDARPRTARSRPSRIWANNSVQMRCWSATRAPPRIAISASCCAGVRPSGSGLGDAGLGLTDQASDPDRVKFIQVGGADRQKPHPFEQRVPRIFRLLQDAMVEVEPRQFAVDKAFRPEMPAFRRTTGPSRPPGQRPRHPRSVSCDVSHEPEQATPVTPLWAREGSGSAGEFRLSVIPRWAKRSDSGPRPLLPRWHRPPRGPSPE